jgi:hypothetical protein
MKNPTSHSSIFISPTIIGRIKLNLGTREGKMEDILIRFHEHTNSRQVFEISNFYIHANSRMLHI